MDYKFAYKLPDGDGGERTVQADSDGQAKLRATAVIADFEDVSEIDVKVTLIAKGDFSTGKYYSCEGCQ
jgi:hypothetical protein